MQALMTATKRWALTSIKFITNQKPILLARRKLKKDWLKTSFSRKKTVVFGPILRMKGLTRSYCFVPTEHRFT